MKLHLSTPGILAGRMAALLGLRRHRARVGTRIQAAGIILGARARVHRSAVLDARGGPITISEGAWIGPDVILLTGDPDLVCDTGSGVTAPVTIGAGAWIGARAILLPGIRVGAGALVGVGAIVTVDVDRDVIVAGSPARPIGRRRDDGSLEFATYAAPGESKGRSGNPASR